MHGRLHSWWHRHSGIVMGTEVMGLMILQSTERQLANDDEMVQMLADDDADVDIENKVAPVVLAKVLPAEMMMR